MTSAFLQGVRSAAAVELAARHIALRDLGRDLPDVEGVARIAVVVLTAAARDPVCQTQDLEVGLLSGKEVDLPRRIEVTEIVVGPDEILSGRDIAIGGATNLRYPDYLVIHPDIGGPQAIVGSRVAIEPSPRLARRDRWDRDGRGRW